VRLTPPRWLLAGVLSMAAMDILLLATGVGQPAAALLDDALGSATQPTFHRAQLGPITKDYPDLWLAAVLGGMFAGRRIQRPAALLVAVLASAYGLLFAVADMLPATVPLALVVALVAWGPGWWPPATRGPHAALQGASRRAMTNPPDALAFFFRSVWASSRFCRSRSLSGRSSCPRTRPRLASTRGPTSWCS
jgi:hypothetical protein